jgi:hypothetical protein
MLDHHMIDRHDARHLHLDEHDTQLRKKTLTMLCITGLSKCSIVFSRLVRSGPGPALPAVSRAPELGFDGNVFQAWPLCRHFGGIGTIIVEMESAR